MISSFIILCQLEKYEIYLDTQFAKGKVVKETEMEESEDTKEEVPVEHSYFRFSDPQDRSNMNIINTAFMIYIFISPLLVYHNTKKWLS